MITTHGREGVHTLRNHQIREVAEAAIGSSDVLAFWFGESHLMTPERIRAAGSAALMGGRTFYAPTLGLPELRQDIAAYLSRLHRPVSSERIAVTSSGVSALMLAAQALVNAGDRVVAVTPVWPNLCEIPKILGAGVDCVSLRFGADGWSLDLDRLLSAIVPGVTALIVNSPNNPTGWTLTRPEQEAILERCRRTGTWLIADDVYERLYFRAACAPSFLDLVDPSDRFVGCNSFSKAWRMTGWRAGWAVMPKDLVSDYGKLLEYNTSCAPAFVQVAARTALNDCEDEVAAMVAQLGSNQRHLYELLSESDRVELGAPAPGGMYAFFRVKGITDSLSLCKRLVAEARVGLA
ncbi:MAG TPA: pyridoxal phosphate-dependent aminotransferase, partial [Steroidobacteraceae bacterium]|nr:pyridoxal phosphate-dependent aminotransferase [Steroidobacteraceae bacterium]